MKKLMLLLAGAMALSFTANAVALFSDNEKWFDGGIEAGWPTTAENGGWDNTNGTTYAESKLTVSALAETPLTFTANVAKVTADYKATISSTVGFTAFEELPAVPEGAKAGVIAHTNGYFYVLADNGSGNAWQKTAIEASEEAAVDITFLDPTNVVYTIGGTPVTNTVAEAAQIQNVCITGDGTLAGLKATAEQKAVTFTIADADNTTKKVEGAELVEGTTYKALPGAEVIVTYTANFGYFFADGSKTYIVDREAGQGITIEVKVDRVVAAAKIGDDKDYFTLTNALEVVENDQTIDLLKEIAIAYDITIGRDVSFTLNLNGQVFTANGAVAINAGTLKLVNGAAPTGLFAPNGVITVANGATLDLSALPFGTTYGGIEGAGSLTLASGSTTKFYFWNAGIVDSPNWMFGNYPAFFTGGAIPDGAIVTIGEKTWTGSAAKERFVVAGEIAIATVTGTHNPPQDPATFDYTESFTSIATAFATSKDKTATLTADVAMTADRTINSDETLVLDTGTLTIPADYKLTLNGTLKCNADGSNFINLGQMLIAQSANVWMGTADMFGKDGKFSIQKGEIVQTTNTGDPTGGMKYTISADGEATMLGDFIEWQPGVYILDTYWLNDGAKFTAVEGDLEQGKVCVKAVNPEKVIVCKDGVYTVADKGPKPAPGSDAEVTPVPGHENTYYVEPGSGKDPVVQNVKSGDTLVVNGGDVDSLTVDTTDNVTVKVMNSAGDVEITAAVKGFSGNTFDATLDETKTVTVGEEQIPVKPTAIESTAGTVAEGAVATKAIPGLTYKLMRGTELGSYKTEAASEKATETTVSLKDETTTKPTDKAFYVIEVTK